MRRAYEDFNARFDELRGDGLEPYFEEFCTPDAALENTENLPVSARHAGYDGWRTSFDDAYGPYADVRWTGGVGRGVGRERPGQSRG